MASLWKQQCVMHKLELNKLFILNMPQLSVSFSSDDERLRIFLFILLIVKLPFFASVFQTWFCFTGMTDMKEHLIPKALNWPFKD